MYNHTWLFQREDTHTTSQTRPSSLKPQSRSSQPLCIQYYKNMSLFFSSPIQTRHSSLHHYTRHFSLFTATHDMCNTDMSLFSLPQSRSSQPLCTSTTQPLFSPQAKEQTTLASPSVLGGGWGGGYRPLHDGRVSPTSGDEAGVVMDEGHCRHVAAVSTVLQTAGLREKEGVLVVVEGQDLQNASFYSRGKFFNVCIVNHWNGLSDAAFSSPSVVCLR